jgi:hypothetical protein
VNENLSRAIQTSCQDRMAACVWHWTQGDRPEVWCRKRHNPCNQGWSYLETRIGGVMSVVTLLALKFLALVIGVSATVLLLWEEKRR